MRRFYILIRCAAAAIAIATAADNCALAVTPSQVLFNNVANDTTEITNILVENSNNSPIANELMVNIGKYFIDVPYKPGTLDGDTEELRVNLQGMDCTTFVENVTALAMTILERRSSWIDFVYNLERIRYRGGNMKDYASRLHYVSDWILDNSHKGIVTEVTDRVGNPKYQIKTLDFMTVNRDKYAALTDSAVFESMKNAQIGYRSHKFPYIKSSEADNAAITPGDIIAITSKTSGLDVSHVGVAVEVNGKIHLLHASSKEGKVCISRLPLGEYLRRNRNATGIRVVRLRN